MRKLIIIIAAITLASTAVNAGPSRSLSLASADANQPATEQAKTQTTAPAATIERPKLGAPQEAARDPATADKPADVARPKHKHVSTEARIIYELHRHGIYW